MDIVLTYIEGVLSKAKEIAQQRMISKISEEYLKRPFDSNEWRSRYPNDWGAQETLTIEEKAVVRLNNEVESLSELVKELKDDNKELTKSESELYLRIKELEEMSIFRLIFNRLMGRAS